MGDRRRWNRRSFIKYGVDPEDGSNLYKAFSVKITGKNFARPIVLMGSCVEKWYKEKLNAIDLWEKY